MSNKTHLESVREKQPELAASWEAMTKEEVLNQISAEVLDLWSMQERVALFMEECTSMSYTTYTLPVIRQLIHDHQNQELSAWCFDTLEEAENDPEEVVEALKEKANEYDH